MSTSKQEAEAHGSRTGHRPGTAVQSRGRQRVSEILDAATGILVEEGYSQLSTRRTAERVGITLSNVQYYFPSRADLIQGLLQRTMDRYAQAFAEKVAASTTKSAESRILRSLDIALKNQSIPEHSSFFVELWAMATHDVEAAGVMHEFYQRWINLTTDMLKEANPRLGLKRARRRALLIISMVDGLSLFRRGIEPAYPGLQGIEKELRDQVLRMIEDI